MISHGFQNKCRSKDPSVFYPPFNLRLAATSLQLTGFLSALRASCSYSNEAKIVKGELIQCKVMDEADRLTTSRAQAAGFGLPTTV